MKLITSGLKNFSLGLVGKKIVHVAVGALHCLAVTDKGEVWAWGDNDHGQQGNNTTVVNRSVRCDAVNAALDNGQLANFSMSILIC